MERSIGAVVFEDSTRLYLIFDGITDNALRPLFSTENAAQNWLDRGMPKTSAPEEAVASEQAVTIITDIVLERKGGSKLVGRFASRASKEAMWLTGPRSFLELIYENGATASRAL